MIRQCLAVAFAIGIGAAAAAQVCPHQVTKPVSAKFDPANAPINSCGSQILIEINGIRIQSSQPLRGCPATMVYYPAHETWEGRPGSNTWAKFERNEPCRIFEFQCVVASSFLFIPLSYHCVLKGESDTKNVGSVAHYTVAPCSELPRPEAEGLQR
jgi:hypothetical protein